MEKSSDAKPTKVPTKLISPELLSKKCSISECWIAYDGIVYDVTQWLSKHPGGIRSIMSTAGHDATSVMKSLHAPDTLAKYLPRIRKVGILNKVSNVDSSKSGNDVSDNLRRSKLERANAIQEDFFKLNDTLVRDGWFEPRMLQYWAQIIRTLVFFVVGVTLILYSQEFHETTALSCLQYKGGLVIGSVLMGLFFQNIAFIGHDAGHGSISGNFQVDYWCGLIVANTLSGIDVGWWKSTHYMHHSATNSLHDDPDIQHMPLLCFEERMVEDRWSTYHGKFMPLCAIGRTILPYQHFYFYPVMAVARINLYLQSYIYLFKICPFLPERDGGRTIVNNTTGAIKEKYAWPKVAPATWIASLMSLMTFQFLLFSLLTSLNLTSAIICFAVSHVVAGILHVQILLSHVAMHYCADGAGTVGANSAPNGYGEVGYYEWQALSTMDIACSPYMDWFHGGLQFQLEHHLFPRLPRYKLREVMPLVDEIFQKHGIKVIRKNFLEGNRMILNHMARIGSTIRKPKGS